MAYTIRPNEYEEAIIKKAMEHLRMGSGSKTMIKSCELVVEQQEDIEKLEREVNKLRSMISRYNYAIDARELADKNMEKLRKEEY